MKLLYTILLLFVLQNTWAQKALKVENHYFEYTNSYHDIADPDTLTCIRWQDSIRIIKYTNGIVKEIQRFKQCLYTRDTTTFLDSLTQRSTQVIHNDFITYPSGVWKHYNPDGKLSLLIQYYKGRKVLITADTNPIKTDTIIVTRDSISLKLAHYKVKYRYVIRRTPHNKYLLLNFVPIYNHSAWRVYDQKPTLKSFISERNQITSIDYFHLMDYPNDNRRSYVDFRKLPKGVYYVCYFHLDLPIYMQEIVLTEH